MTLTTTAAAATTTTTTTTPLPAGTWNADTAHSSVEFTIRHLGLSKVRGRFTDFSAALHVGESLPSSSLEATIELASVNTANADRDAHLRSTDFFGVDVNPQMHFRSTSITEGGDGYVLQGELTLNGITQPVTLDVEFNGVEVYPMDQKRHAGFSANGTISRREYGIDFDVPLGVDKVALGDKVRIELEIQVVEPG